MLGGGMRQSGILAAAGIYALENHIDRLQEDHDRARRLGAGIADVAGDAVAVEPVQSNMVLVDVAGGRAPELKKFLKAAEIQAAGYTGDSLRLVTHLGIADEDVDTVSSAFAKFFAT